MNLLPGRIYHGHRQSHLLWFTWNWTMEQHNGMAYITMDVDMAYSCHEISDMLEGDYIHLSSDKSAVDGRMSFAWRICNKEAKTLAQHAGPEFGKESSFRSKAYGVLSA
eukprot:13545961-Ditylum_brightwellii.AAC.1